MNVFDDCNFNYFDAFLNTHKKLRGEVQISIYHISPALHFVFNIQTLENNP